jgi:hypothetical protein
MKIHTTNYKDTFIMVADDCPASSGEIPPDNKSAKTVAGLQYDLVSKNPYRFTSDDVLFQVYAQRNDLAESGLQTAREQFFSKGQPCFRASPLTKRYGWGIHCNKDGKIALFGCDTDAYQKWAADKNVKVVKAMRTGK